MSSSTQEDPIGLAGGLNLYGYADGDPVNYADPFGLYAERLEADPDAEDPCKTSKDIEACKARAAEEQQHRAVCVSDLRQLGTQMAVDYLGLSALKSGRAMMQLASTSRAWSNGSFSTLMKNAALLGPSGLTNFALGGSTLTDDATLTALLTAASFVPGVASGLAAAEAMQSCRAYLVPSAR